MLQLEKWFQATVLMEMSDLLEDLVTMKDELKYALTEHGEQCAMEVLGTTIGK